MEKGNFLTNGHICHNFYRWRFCLLYNIGGSIFQMIYYYISEPKERGENKELKNIISYCSRELIVIVQFRIQQHGTLCSWKELEKPKRCARKTTLLFVAPSLHSFTFSKWFHFFCIFFCLQFEPSKGTGVHQTCWWHSESKILLTSISE